MIFSGFLIKCAILRMTLGCRSSKFGFNLINSLSTSSSLKGVIKKPSLIFLPTYVLNDLAGYGMFFAKFGPTWTKYLLKFSAIIKGSDISSSFWQNAFRKHLLGFLLLITSLIDFQVCFMLLCVSLLKLFFVVSFLCVIRIRCLVYFDIFYALVCCLMLVS